MGARESSQHVALALATERLAAPVHMGMAQIEQHEHWPVLAQIELRMVALAQVPRFTVRDLLALRPGSVLETEASCAQDVPVRVGGVAFAWSEFEVVEQRLAVRLTRLA